MTWCGKLQELGGIAPPEKMGDEIEQRLDVEEIHLRAAIARNLTQIAPDLTPYFEDRFQEYPIPAGRIDLLCKDAGGLPAIVELKRQHWSADKAIGQIARYMGWASHTLADGGRVRGILLIPDDGALDQRLEDAEEAVPGLEIRRYAIKFQII